MSLLDVMASIKVQATTVLTVPAAKALLRNLDDLSNSKDKLTREDVASVHEVINQAKLPRQLRADPNAVKDLLRTVDEAAAKRAPSMRTILETWGHRLYAREKAAELAARSQVRVVEFVVAGMKED